MKISNEEIENVLEAIGELQADSSMPKNIKAKLELVTSLLKEKNGDKLIMINKALDELEELSNDSNVQPYTRTQLWNLISMLESISR